MVGGRLALLVARKAGVQKTIFFFSFVGGARVQRKWNESQNTHTVLWRWNWSVFRSVLRENENQNGILE